MPKKKKIPFLPKFAPIQSRLAGMQRRLSKKLNGNKVSKSIGIDRQIEVNNSEYLVANPFLAITTSSLWPTDITKLFHSSFVMLFQAFITASLSCLFWGVTPFSLLFSR